LKELFYLEIIEAGAGPHLNYPKYEIDDWRILETMQYQGYK
jgi:hypothetical protein